MVIIKHTLLEKKNISLTLFFIQSMEWYNFQLTRIHLRIRYQTRLIRGISFLYDNSKIQKANGFLVWERTMSRVTT